MHAAASAAEALQTEHEGAEVTVRLLPGVHALAGRPLVPGHRQLWVGEFGPGGEPSIVSGGASVTGWHPNGSHANNPGLDVFRTEILRTHMCRKADDLKQC